MITGHYCYYGHKNEYYIEFSIISSHFLDVIFGLLMLLNLVLLLAQNDPVILIVILVAVALEKIFEHGPHG